MTVFILNEHIAKKVAPYLIQLGHKVISVKRGINDSVIAKQARRMDAIVITGDKYFSDKYPYIRTIYVPGWYRRRDRILQYISQYI